MLLVFGSIGARSADSTRRAPKLLRSAIGCLLTEDYVKTDLKELGLGLNGKAWARFHVGPVKGTTPVPNEIQVAVYAPGGARGWLLLAESDAPKSVMPLRNAYRLARNGTQWEADEGSGGLQTYKVMSAFATELYHTYLYRVDLEANQGSCSG